MGIARESRSPITSRRTETRLKTFRVDSDANTSESLFHNSGHGTTSRSSDAANGHALVRIRRRRVPLPGTFPSSSDDIDRGDRRPDDRGAQPAPGSPPK